MIGPFESPKLLLERANKHLIEFESIERGFMSKEPYRLFTEIDPQSGDTIFKAKLILPLPQEILPVTFDIINSLRSALDHVVYDSAKVLGGTPKPKYTKFPFGVDAKSAEDALPRKRAEVPESIRPYLLATEPYKGGKDALWELNEMRNNKIHRTLSAAIVSTGGIGFGNGFMKNMSITTASEWDSTKGELTYMRVGIGAKANVQISVSAHIAFGEDTHFAGKRALRVLSNFAKIIERIILGIEAETARLIKERT